MDTAIGDRHPPHRCYRLPIEQHADAPSGPAAPTIAATALGSCAWPGQSQPPLDRLITLADLYGLTPAVLLARNTVTVSLIAAIDCAEEAAIARLATLLGASDDGLWFGRWKTVYCSRMGIVVPMLHF